MMLSGHVAFTSPFSAQAALGGASMLALATHASARQTAPKMDRGRLGDDGTFRFVVV